MGHFSVLKTRDLPGERSGIAGKGRGRTGDIEVIAWQCGPLPGHELFQSRIHLCTVLAMATSL